MTNNKKRILLIEDDTALRESLKITINGFGYDVTEATDGRVARGIAMLEKFDMVISDIQMPHLNGIEFLQWFRGAKFETPMLMITGFSNLLDSKSAIEYGAQDFLAKPFARDDLKKIINQYLQPTPETSAAEKINPENDEKNYRKVSIEEFVSPQFVDYPIFIKLPGSRFVKIAHGGGKVDSGQVSRYKEKGINYLWIKKEDFKKVLSFNLSFAKIVSKSDKLSIEKKLGFLKYTAETVLENIFAEVQNPEDLSFAKDFMGLTLEVASQDDDLFSLLESLQNHTDHIYAHSVAVSVYAVMLAKKLGWATSNTLSKLGLAALMHDIGKKEISKEILTKSRAKLTPEEVKILESHTVRGRDILSQMKSIPGEVIEVAYQHHELSHGGGYPRGVSQNQIHPFSKVVAIANRFCELTIAGPNRTPMTAKEAFAQLSFSSDDFFPQYWDAFKELFPQKTTQKAA